VRGGKEEIWFRRGGARESLVGEGRRSPSTAKEIFSFRDTYVLVKKKVNLITSHPSQCFREGLDLPERKEAVTSFEHVQGHGGKVCI